MCSEDLGALGVTYSTSSAQTNITQPPTHTSADTEHHGKSMRSTIPIGAICILLAAVALLIFVIFLLFSSRGDDGGEIRVSTHDGNFGGEITIHGYHDSLLSYAIFLELLEGAGLVVDGIETISADSDWWNSVDARIINIGDHQIIVYEYASNEAMIKEVTRAIRSPSEIHNPDGSFTLISWAGSPYWFKRDLILVSFIDLF